MTAKEIERRPFVRSLLVWIVGILLQTYLGCSLVAVLVPPAAVAVAGVCRLISRRKQTDCCYGMRWVWGAVFLSLLLSFAMQRTAYRMAHSADAEQSVLSEVAREEQVRLLKPFDALKLTDEERSVLATLTLGYREGMSRKVNRQFSVTGVAHILSVSGFHVAVVCGFLSAVFSFLPKNRVFRWIRYVSMMALLWCFVVVTGMSPPAIRAGLMLSLYLTGHALRRRTDGYNTLAAAAFCMLAYDPSYLFDIGFQLSYLAVLSILFLQPHIRGLIAVRNPLLREPWGWISVSIAAQAGTMLLCLYYFRQFSPVFLLTNLPLSFLSMYLIPAALILVVLPQGMPGYALLQLIVEKLTHALFWIVDAFSRVTHATLWCRVDGWFTFFGYAAILLFLIYIKTRRPAHLLSALTLLLALMLTLLAGRFV